MEHEPNKKPAFDATQVQAFLEQNRAMVARIVGAARVAIAELTPQMQQIKTALKSILPPIADLMNEVNGLPAEYRAAMLVVANKGWYLGPEMAFDEPMRIAAAYADGRGDEAEFELVEHFRARVDAIEADLVNRFPMSEPVLRQAFEAHRLGLYYASIPTFLTQVDGVCLDITTTSYLFLKERGEKRTGVAPYVDQIAEEPITQAMLAPFLEPHTILLSESQRPADFEGLNRHMVLHGQSLDHGTEANSLRAVSLLYYSARALEEFNDVRAKKPSAGDLNPQ